MICGRICTKVKLDMKLGRFNNLVSIPKRIHKIWFYEEQGIHVMCRSMSDHVKTREYNL
ncbi:hypothetical protein HanPI659440_Chr13g0521151 [Helianthus annuus]|nr:hypothetical protein HanPI659440_Chr13g0521151 [Helianthus annuus]